jgi:hypothetical protein
MWRATGRHPVWIEQSQVGAIEVSTVFLSMLGSLLERPFETWVRGPDHEDFYRYRTAQEARASHWCLVWQLHEEARHGR